MNEELELTKYVAEKEATLELFPLAQEPLQPSNLPVPGDPAYEAQEEAELNAALHHGLGAGYDDPKLQASFEDASENPNRKQLSGYYSLPLELRREVHRVHRNLGHPPNEK